MRPPWQDSLRSTEPPIADEVLKGRNYFRNLWTPRIYPRVPIQRQTLLHGGPEEHGTPSIYLRTPFGFCYSMSRPAGLHCPTHPKEPICLYPTEASKHGLHLSTLLISALRRHAHLPCEASILTWPCPTTTCFLTKPTVNQLPSLTAIYPLPEVEFPCL